jgi:hypothetical protein
VNCTWLQCTNNALLVHQSISSGCRPLGFFYDFLGLVEELVDVRLLQRPRPIGILLAERFEVIGEDHPEKLEGSPRETTGLSHT